jgi:folate-dependent phosphoribosylglycinamide formyltransferase PurN
MYQSSGEYTAGCTVLVVIAETDEGKGRYVFSGERAQE